MPSAFRCVPAVLSAVLLFSSPLVSAPPTLGLEPYASGFTAPVAVVQDPADPLVQFVVEQRGRIRTVVAGVVQPADFLDLRGSVASAGERGLLGMAFPPDAAATRRFFVNYTDLNGHTVVARYTRSANPRIADPSSRAPLTWSTGLPYIEQPFANHNGGWLAFGPDGYLYVGMGDGGSANDPLNNGQNVSTLLGKMLRVDVSGDAPGGFRVPADNPFLQNAAYRPEIWAIGFRNPWRYTFDDPGRGGTGALVIGDVGQGRWEEIDYEPAGAGGRNYGWVLREGSEPTLGAPAFHPSFLPLTDPVHQYDHTVGASVTGGYVYRGLRMGALYGRYFFADFITGRVWSAQVTVNPASREGTFGDITDHTAALRATSPLGNVSSFGVDALGELFVVDYSRGAVLRIVQLDPRPAAPGNFRIIR
ncbi:MAG TPA: PQQ-dependent sugar dehydrogenase [Vicinamibacterales bacterium]|nr:PQQ-dependent sugar dehydrogenase [Vicinamibacterales bacterium]